MENPEIARKEEEGKQLLINDEQLDQIFEALGPEEMLEEMIKFYGKGKVAYAMPDDLVPDIVLERRHSMSVSQLETVEYFAKTAIYGKFKLEESD